MTHTGTVKFVRVVRENDIATLAEVKEAARVDVSDDDGFIGFAMKSAKTFIEDKLKRPIDNCLWEVSFDFTGANPKEGDFLWFPVAPIDSITVLGSSDLIPLEKLNPWLAYLEYDSDYGTKQTFSVNTVWSSSQLDTIVRIPFYSVCQAFIQTRENSLQKAPGVLTAVEAAIGRYAREIV